MAETIRYHEYYGHAGPDMEYADLHLHTNIDDGILKPGEIIDTALKRGLSAIAVTPHETIKGAVEAQEYALKQGTDLLVIVGAEISTRGLRHLLALNIEHDIPSGKDLDWTIRQIHKQDGLAIAPHPMFRGGSIGEKQMTAIINHPDPEVYFDGIEIYNAELASLPFSGFNESAKRFYIKHKIKHKDKLGAPVGGSDGHYPGGVGLGMTGYNRNLGIIKAIKEGDTVVLFRSEREERRLLDYLRQAWRSMVLEPFRRFGRWGGRVSNGEERLIYVRR